MKQMAQATTLRT